jgi:threonyl-tRNA synthetase
VLPVGSQHDAAARRLSDDLIAAGLRSRIEAAGSLGARVRSSRQRRDHLVAVLGDAEVAGQRAEVTDVAAGFRGPVETAEFIRLVRRAYEERSSGIDWGRA